MFVRVKAQVVVVRDEFFDLNNYYFLFAYLAHHFMFTVVPMYNLRDWGEKIGALQL